MTENYNNYINKKDYTKDLHDVIETNNQISHDQEMKQVQMEEHLEDKITDREDRKKNKRLRKIWDNICLVSLTSMTVCMPISMFMSSEYCESISKTGPHMLIPLVPLVSYITLSYLTAVRMMQVREKQNEDYKVERKLRRNQNK